VVAVGQFAADTAVAGLQFDSWNEALPADRVTAGASFHYDAPLSRPPQAVLLAVPADPARASWDFDSLLATINETLELSKLRLVGPNELPATVNALFPATELPSGSLHELLPRTNFHGMVTRFATDISTKVVGR
jgi:hypothetical protein